MYKKEKNAVGEQPHGKSHTLFPKPTERHKINMCILILSPPNCCKTSEKTDSFEYAFQKGIVYS